MPKPKLHNKIARSIVLLPLCSLIAIALWWLPAREYDAGDLVGVLLAGLIAYVIMETNNAYQLLRVSSRMVSAMWLILLACMGTTHTFQPSLLAAFCLSVSYFLLFRTYQLPEPVVDVFHSVLLISLGSLFFPPLIYFAPFYLWYLLVFMRVLSFRTLMSALIALIAPFWFWTGWLLWNDDLTPLWQWIHGLDLRLTTQPFLTVATLPETLVTPLPDPVLLSIGLLAFFVLWTLVYYLMNSYDDKIRTRMMLYIYIFQSVLTLLMMLFTSHQYPLSSYLPLLMLNVSPLIAHYVTLRHTWLALIVFFLSLFSLAFIAAYALWPRAVINFVNPMLMSE